MARPSQVKRLIAAAHDELTDADEARRKLVDAQSVMSRSHPLSSAERAQVATAIQDGVMVLERLRTALVSAQREAARRL